MLHTSAHLNVHLRSDNLVSEVSVRNPSQGTSSARYARYEHDQTKRSEFMSLIGEEDTGSKKRNDSNHGSQSVLQKK